MTHFESKYLGELRTENTHLKSGTHLITDAPVDNHGKGASFSPTDLLATALASCMMTVMGILANKEGLNIEGMKYSTEKIMQNNPRRVQEVVIRFSLENHQLNEAQQQKLIDKALNCPVALSLANDLKQTVSFQF